MKFEDLEGFFIAGGAALDLSEYYLLDQVIERRHLGIVACVSLVFKSKHPCIKHGPCV